MRVGPDDKEKEKEIGVSTGECTSEMDLGEGISDFGDGSYVGDRSIWR